MRFITVSTSPAMAEDKRINTDFVWAYEEVKSPTRRWTRIYCKDGRMYDVFESIEEIDAKVRNAASYGYSF